MDFLDNKNFILRVDTQNPRWYKVLVRSLDNIEGITYWVSKEAGMAQISGNINQREFMRKLAKAGLTADLHHVDSVNNQNNTPLMNGSNFYFHGNYGFDPYGRAHYFHRPYGYPPQRYWNPSYAYYSQYPHAYGPYYEPPARYFPQPPPPPENFNVGEAQWCSIM